MRTRLVWALVCLIFILVGIAATFVAHRRPTSALSVLTQTDRLLIARAVAEHQSALQFMFACEPQRTASLVSVLRSNGVVIHYNSPRIGYVRATVPLSEIDKLAANPLVQAVNVSTENQFDFDLNGLHTRGSDAVLAPPIALPTPGTGTANGAFTDFERLGIPAFRRAHPTYDGRGAVIGILEAADPLAPGLRYARSLNGHFEPKFLSYRVTEGPFDDEPAYGGVHNVRLGWVDMYRRAVSTNGAFTLLGRRYQAPYDAEFRLGFFNANSAPWLQFKSTSRVSAGHEVTSDTTFPVLWDVARDRVWINKERDGDFREDVAVSDYRSSNDIVTLPLELLSWESTGQGKASKAGGPSPVAHFIIQTDTTDHFIRFDATGINTHGTMVAGSAAASGLLGKSLEGVAPGAQLAVVDGNWPYMVEALIRLAESRVDVITVEFELTPYSSGDGVLDTMVSRIIAAYNVPIVFSAGNGGPGMQSVQMPSIAQGAISVGAYVSPLTARYDEGAVIPAGMLTNYSARGPAPDGAMKPDVIALSEYLTSGSSEAPPQVFRQTLYLPNGYEIGGGTSQAAPTVAGLLALMISAAKQSGVHYSAASLKQALVASGDALSYSPYEVGSGLVNIQRAWDRLRILTTMTEGDFEVTAPVETVTSSALTDPNRGRGLFLREGWHKNQSGTRAIEYTTSIASRRVFGVRIVGDTSTFSVPAQIVLGGGKASALKISVYPHTSGVHSAVIVLLDQRYRTVVNRTLCTVVASETFSKGNHFTINHAGSVPHPGVRRYFFYVPSNTSVFAVDVQAIEGGLASRFNAFSGQEFMRVRQPDGRQPPLSARYRPVNDGLHWAQAFPHPMVGVWEVDITNWDPGYFSADPTLVNPIPPTRYNLRASVYRLVLLRSKSISTREQELIFRNDMAPLSHISYTLQSVKLTSQTIKMQPFADTLVTFNVPPVTSDVFVRVLSAASKQTVSKVYLFNCDRASKRAIYWYQGLCNLVSAAEDGGLAEASRPTNWVSGEPSFADPKGAWSMVLEPKPSGGPEFVSTEVGSVLRDGATRNRIIGERLDIGAELRFKVTTPPLSATRAALVNIEANEVMSIWQKGTMDAAELAKGSAKALRRYMPAYSLLLHAPLTNRRS